MNTRRMVVPAAEEIIGSYFPVLDHGFLAFLDYMGGDLAIEQAARCSYTIGSEVRDIKETRRLIRYLFRHRHCYRGDMAVLTMRGWVRWDECGGEETFLVPHPVSRKLVPERLHVEMFDCDEHLLTMENQRMSFAVTNDHRMFFRRRNHDNFVVERAGSMSQWGHFDPLLGYEHVSPDGPIDSNYAMIGFILGDGSWAPSGRQVFFHLRKQRKKDYLLNLVAGLEWACHCVARPSTTYSDATCFTISLPDNWNPIGLMRAGKSHTKAFDLNVLQSLDHDAIRGLFDGLINSDGSLKADRPQVQYSSESEHLIRLFEALAAFMGLDAHADRGGDRLPIGRAVRPWRPDPNTSARPIIEARSTVPLPARDF
jgi:hypothetical protein